MLDRGTFTGSNAVPYLRNINVQWGRFELEDILTIEIPPERQSFFELCPGDLMVCEGGEIGRCAVWPGSKTYMAFQKALHRVRPYPGVDARFLRYLLEHYSRTNMLAPYSTGSTIKHLPQQQLRLLPLPLPPQAEQRRIVNSIEVQISRLDAAANLINGASKKVRRLEPSTVLKALSTVECSTVRLACLLREPLVNGRSVPTRIGGFPVLRLSALTSGNIQLAERKDGAWSRGQATPFLVKTGDYLISRGNGSLSLVGRGSAVTMDPGDVAFPDTMIRIRPNEELLTLPYLALIWNLPMIRRQIEEKARTTAGIYKVNQSIIEDIDLPLPSREDQTHVVQHVDTVSPKIMAARGSILSAQVRTTSLRHALFREAFSGRLVRQNPADEPASVLLDRIRAQAKHRGALRSAKNANPEQESMRGHSES
jgi:type I restriction enzyme S subunit